MSNEELNEFLGEGIMEIIFNLPIASKNNVLKNLHRSFLKKDFETKEDAVLYILEEIASEHKRQNHAEVTRCIDTISEGIIFLKNNKNWPMLNKVSITALTAAIEACVDGIDDSVKPHLRVKLDILKTDVSTFATTIKTMKELMIGQAVKIIDGFRKESHKPFDPYLVNTAKGLIKDLIDMNSHFHYNFDNGDKIYIRLTYIKQSDTHIPVEYNEIYYEQAGGPLGFYILISQYFPTHKLDEAITVFIERAISENPTKLKGTVLTIQDIQAKAALMN